MRFGNECKNALGHLPFHASLALTAWTSRLPAERCWVWSGGHCSGKRLGTFSEEIMSRGVSHVVMPDRGRSKPGRRAWSKLHYQEYLAERISVNPNRYKDFCVFLLRHRFIENFVSASILAFCFWFSFFEAPCLLNEWLSSPLSPPTLPAPGVGKRWPKAGEKRGSMTWY